MIALERIPTIDLVALNARAALQTRRDRKYVVPRCDLAGIVDRMSRDGTRVLEIGSRRSFGYESVYLDTPELVCYFDAVRRRPRRFKVRTRRYLDGGGVFLEAKVRDRRGFTVKHRIAVGTHGDLTPAGRIFLRGVDGVTVDPRRLGPTLSTRYRRVTVVDVGSSARSTIDTELTWMSTEGEQLALDDVAIIETKSGGPPSAFDRRLWALGHRPAKISKYGSGLAAFDHTLPANKWHRVLDAHFGRAGSRRTPSLLVPTLEMAGPAMGAQGA